MCPFQLTVHVNESDIRLKPTSFIELNEIRGSLIQFLKDKSDRIQLKNPSVHCFHYQDDYGSILFVQNKVNYSKLIIKSLFLSVVFFKYPYICRDDKIS